MATASLCSLSVPEEQNSGKPQHTPPLPSSSPSQRPQRPPSLEHSGGSPLSTPRRVREPSGRTRGGGASASRFPQTWAENLSINVPPAPGWQWYQ
ncbi:uncharacterized protein LOC129818352 isoform X2 [Salvelinus fontinalis]|uniref:uncharacterized protein LOC129818352 isoform X2 n=1 Tax=Salvelinus fontinalis TaxID=8038 RepID=UPI0024850639|nr:uncharacterized protein LOC129818352 isoform X2 [Salvelinus fontinalis]